MKRIENSPYEFLSRVGDRTDPEKCWEWQGVKRALLYGGFYAEGKGYYAHRWMWEYAYGKIPEGLTIDHLCRNTLCVNPYHLRLATQRENILAGGTRSAFHAKKDYCDNGHYFSDRNTYRWRGSRCCRRCRADAAMRFRKRAIQSQD
jgi:hypothetical protein